MSRTLSYASSKCVLLYLEPNLRFTISQHCPSLKTADNAVPLSIHTLEIDHLQLQINDTTYKLGIIQIYDNKQTPLTVRQDNFNGGISEDVDQYGIRRTEEVGHETMMKSLRAKKHGLEANRADTGAHEPEEVKRLNEQIKKVELQMLSCTLRQTNATPPFTHYLQMLVQSNRRFWKERISYEDKTLTDAKEYLLKKLFENRKTVLVDTLIVKSQQDLDMRASLLSLAPGKLDVRDLTITTNVQKVLDSLKPILGSKPLESIRIDESGITPECYHHPVITSAEHLFISKIPSIERFIQFPNNRIHFRGLNYGEEQLEVVIAEWMINGVATRKYYTIGSSNEYELNHLLKRMKRISGGEMRKPAKLRDTPFPKCLIIPIQDHSEIHIYSVEPSIEEREVFKDQYIMKIKVQPRGFAYHSHL